MLHAKNKAVQDCRKVTHDEYLLEYLLGNGVPWKGDSGWDP